MPNQIPLRTIRTTIRLTVDEVASIAAYQRERGHGSVSSAVRELLVRGLRGSRDECMRREVTGG